MKGNQGPQKGAEEFPVHNTATGWKDASLACVREGEVATRTFLGVLGLRGVFEGEQAGEENQGDTANDDCKGVHGEARLSERAKLLNARSFL